MGALVRVAGSCVDRMKEADVVRLTTSVELAAQRLSAVLMIKQRENLAVLER